MNNAMNVPEAIMVLAGIPAAVFALAFLVTYTGSRERRSVRYRPGLPLSFEPVWFLAPRTVAADARNARRHRQLAAGASSAPVSSGRADADLTGGARASW